MYNYKFKQWLMLFSHSGSEAAALYGIQQNVGSRVKIDVLTNNPHFREGGHFPVEVFDFAGDDPDAEIITNTYTPVSASASVLHQRLVDVDVPTLVTLHGYNRILPKEVLDNTNLEIYNLHPGDVMSFPELVGKDPQEKAMILKLPHTGVILHRVTEELDGGPVYGFIRRDIKEGWDLARLVEELKEDALNLWFPFILGKLDEAE